MKDDSTNKTEQASGQTNESEKVERVKEDLRTKVAQAAPTSPQRGRSVGKFISAALLVILLCFSAGAAGAWLVNQSSERSAMTSLRSGEDGNKIVTAQEEDIAGVAQKVAPSVVSILTQSERQSYFGGSRTQQGAGTGIIVSKDGYILTNKHVVEGSDTVSVVTTDGATYDNVRVIGADPLNDLAFLKISGVNDLTVAELGDSSSLRIGQSVVAIGNALGQYKNTVTSGIVSGTGRSVTAAAEGSGQAETLTDLIQTDAAINPGNSGGPLVNLAGQVIGINTAIASDANGLGFSIPINAAKGLLKGVLANGKVERAFVGVNYITITPEVTREYKLPVTKGALVRASNGSAVQSGSPAEKAGLKDGDIITKVNDVEVGDKGSVASLVAEYAPGDKITITILRDGRVQTLDLTLASYSS